MEADLRRYYGIRLSDLWRPDPPFNLRELTNYVYALPVESWTAKYLSDSLFDYQDEMQAILIDLLRENVFTTHIAAASLAGKDYRKVAPKAPKPFERPTLKPKPKAPKKFVKPSELKRMLATKRVTIHHTPSCIQSKINEGGQKLNCSCPRG